MGFSENSRFAQKRRERGFTLIEALTSLTVASILVTAAVPALQNFIIRNRMSTEVNSFVGSLYLARSEAVKRLHNVSLCTVDASGNCDASQTDWAHGWKVYYTDPATGNPVTLQQTPALPGRFTVNANQSAFAYDPTGKLARAATNGTYVFCDTGNIARPRDVIVSAEGRVRSHVATDCTAGG
ncbi:MAG: GspH/FimT family pseudopilin [Gammaproteobacteria bacterium]|jgi:type IV fimbrial biogenesis protein FimT